MDLKERTTSATARHPWEIARAKALGRILETLQFQKPIRVLDLGCGDGYAAHELFCRIPHEMLVGCDNALNENERRELAATYPGMLFVANLDELELKQFDFLLLLDVLEHLDDDAALLDELVSDHLGDGAYALITVPAFAELTSAHDRFLGHRRRYARSELITVIENCGLVPLQNGYLFGSLLPVRLLLATMEKLFPSIVPEPRGVGKWSHGKYFSELVKLLLTLDNNLLLALSDRGWRIPGLTIWTLAQKQS